ncbi:hypothetical protein [Tuberibacillus calidus]|jgi:hypothetical protein|uniref:hypothetical protein n=1 Tax=Tuberibacillus calidus TaxID=340097 RepID=UPI0003F7A485|nr:hypothetical protein [Tuberibacillus calidus]
MKKEQRIKKDLEYEGRKEYELDVDRMINEGMAGGTVNPDYEHPSVGYTHDIVSESKNTHQ